MAQQAFMLKDSLSALVIRVYNGWSIQIIELLTPIWRSLCHISKCLVYTFPDL